MEFGERLALAIELSPYAARGGRPLLAAAIGSTPQAISQVLNGSSKALTAENCVRAARFLEVDAHWLATGEGEPHPFLNDEAVSVAKRYLALNAAQRERLLKALQRVERGSD